MYNSNLNVNRYKFGIGWITRTNRYIMEKNHVWRMKYMEPLNFGRKRRNSTCQGVSGNLSRVPHAPLQNCRPSALLWTFACREQLLETNAARLRRISLHRAQMWWGLPYVTRPRNVIVRPPWCTENWNSCSFTIVTPVLNTWQDASRLVLIILCFSIVGKLIYKVFLFGNVTQLGFYCSGY